MDGLVSGIDGFACGMDVFVCGMDGLEEWMGVCEERMGLCEDCVKLMAAVHCNDRFIICCMLPSWLLVAVCHDDGLQFILCLQYFYSIALTDGGRLEARLSADSPNTVLKSTKAYNDGAIHYVALLKNGRKCVFCFLTWKGGERGVWGLGYCFSCATPYLLIGLRE